MRRTAPLALQALEEAGKADQQQVQQQAAEEEGPAHALYQQLVSLGLLRR
jgi:hypothetical protein